MKICHYNDNQAGVIVADKVYNVGEALIKAGLARNGYTMLEIIDALANNPQAPQIARDASQSAGAVPLSSVKLLAPITNPGSLWAVIGKRARKVTEDQALDYVFGYLMCWDISQRDPWGRGMHNTRNIRKGFDTFSGLGPWIVTKDEIGEPQNLTIKVLQNGKEVMTAHTSDMICGLREHIRFLTSCLTLRPGDLVTTGTPAGVSKLQDGDHLEGTIEKIGSMELNVKAEL